MKYYYSKGWFRAKKEPLALYSESEAKVKHENKELYCVLVGSTDKPFAFIDVNNDFYGVAFLDEHLRNNLDYHFTLRANGQLFLQMAVYREYDGSTDKVTGATTYLFETNGKTSIIKTDLLTGEKLESSTESDISTNWEQLPGFGSYDGLLKLERSG